MRGSTIQPAARGELRLIPPVPPQWPRQLSEGGHLYNPPVHICILDSSFNPPTLAHLTMAASAFPKISATGIASAGSNNSASENSTEQYTARLLLFSTSNVEKTPSPDDPTLDQRLKLVSLLTAHIGQTSEPLAVGLINEPTFVGKSKIIHSFLAPTLGNRPKLSFMIGTDTLTRCFDPRFYGAVPGGMEQSLSDFFETEGSTLVCARRKGESGVEEALIRREEVRRCVEMGQVRFFGSGEEDWAGMSSTQVREAVKAGKWDQVRNLVIPEIAEYIQSEVLYSEAP